MGTTKDPEGFRRHTAGRGDVLGIKGGGPKRRGCGLGLALLVAALALAVAARMVLMRSDRDVPAVAGAAVPASGSALRTTGPVPDAVAPNAGSEALTMLPESVESHATDRRLVSTETPTAPGSASESSALASIRLLRGWSDAPFADVEVFWIGKAELARLRRNGLMITTVELEPVLRRLGRHASSGPDGLLSVAADGSHLLVLGEGWTRELEVSPDLLGITDVRIFVPRTLTIDVVDWRGAPAFDVGVDLWRVDATGVPHRRMENLRLTPSTGSIRFEDVDAALSSWLESQLSPQRGIGGTPIESELPELERTRLRVALDRDLAPEAWAEIDLAQDPLPHVRLRLPPLGELHVVVADSEGRPVTWRGEAELRLAEAEYRQWSRELVEGRTMFGNLRFGRALYARALRLDGAKGEWVRIAPLTPDDPEREVALTDVAPQARLLMRPIHPGGFALPRTWCDVRLEAQRPATESERRQANYERLAEESKASDSGVEILWRSGRFGQSVPQAVGISYRHVLLTDTGGFLDVPLPSGFLGSAELTVVVSLVRDGKTLSSTEQRFERGEAWRDIDLGNVPLLEPVADPNRSR